MISSTRQLQRRHTEQKTKNSPDLISSLHSDPLWNGPVLFLLLGKEALDPESLVGRLERKEKRAINATLYIYNRCCTAATIN